MPYIQKRRISPPNNHKEVSERRNNKWGKYYGSVAWKHLRDYYHMLHPICYCCALEGRSVPSEEVHHITPYSWFNLEEDRMKALLDPDNLRCLCKSCHLKIHQQLKKPDNFEQTVYYKKIHDS